MKRFFINFFTNAFVINIALAFLITCVLLYGTLVWLDIYTRHNKAVVVPDVKGLSVSKAASFFESSGVRYKVIDSVFSKTVEPGSIVEIIPDAGSKVKEGRIVFITVNALTSQMAIVPQVKDLSYRQAYAMLKAAGFKYIETEYKAGEYRDLVIGVKYNGALLEEVQRIPLSAHLVLQISNGNQYMDSDSLNNMEKKPVQELNSDNEKWF